MPGNKLSKRNFYLYSIAVIVILVFSISPEATAAKRVKVGSVEQVIGRASVTHHKEKKSIVIRAGMPIYQMDTIKTQPGGKVRVAFLDQSVISVASGTKLVITEYVFNPDKKERRGRLSILWGKVKCLVNDVAGYRTKKFNVTTHTAVIGVRGTDFLVWVPTKGKTTVAALKNAVDVASTIDKVKTYLLEPGNFSDILMGKAPTAPAKIPPEMYKTLLDGLMPSDAVPPDVSQASSASQAASGAAKAAGTAAKAAAGAAEATAGKAALTAAGVAVAAGAAAGATAGAVSSAANVSGGGESGGPSGAAKDPKTETAADPGGTAAGASTAGGGEAASTPATASQPTQVAASETPAAAPAKPSIESIGPPVVDLRVQTKKFRDDLHTQQSERKTRKKYKRFLANHPEANKNRFVDMGDGTVIDKATGLMWDKGYTERNVSSYALEYADKANRAQLGGFNDWRLPTTEELLFLYLSVEADRSIPIKMPGENIGLWTGDFAINGYVFGWFYKSIFSKGVQLKNPTIPGSSHTSHHVKAVRTIKKK